MSISTQGGTAPLEAVLATALEAAANRAISRAGDVIASARLATAVHMRRAAEHAAAQNHEDLASLQAGQPSRLTPASAKRREARQ